MALFFRSYCPSAADETCFTVSAEPTQIYDKEACRWQTSDVFCFICALYYGHYSGANICKLFTVW